MKAVFRSPAYPKSNIPPPWSESIPCSCTWYSPIILFEWWMLDESFELRIILAYTKIYFFFTVRSKIPSSTALGVAIAAAQAEGIEIWKFDENEETQRFLNKGFDRFEPKVDHEG